VGTGDVASTSTDRIIEMMVGRKLDEMFPKIPHKPGETLLELDGLCGVPKPQDVHLELRRGEILGLAGLIGAGRTELLRTVFGLDRVRRGKVRLAVVRWGRTRYRRDSGKSPARRIRQKMGMLSEDRKEEGLALPMSIADNMTLSRLGKVGRMGIVNVWRQAHESARWIQRLDLRCEGPAQEVWHLSGGNQQKVAIARLLHQDADILLLDEPTRGIDVGAKVQIFQLMGELVAAGKAVLFVSSYLPELMGVCHRIGVMSRGKLIEIRDTEHWTEHEIMLAATGAAG
jgi:ribose transport system ATP-binding protein